jgi:hypothetical protein
VNLDNSGPLKDLAKLIIEDSNKLTQIWMQLDYFATHGVMRDEAELKDVAVEDLELSDIITRLLTVPSFISKSRKKIKLMPEGDERKKLLELVEAKERELEAIKNLRYKK